MSTPLLRELRALKEALAGITTDRNRVEIDRALWEVGKLSGELIEHEQRSNLFIKYHRTPAFSVAWPAEFQGGVKYRVECPGRNFLEYKLKDGPFTREVIDPDGLPVPTFGQTIAASTQAPRFVPPHRSPPGSARQTAVSLAPAQVPSPVPAPSVTPASQDIQQSNTLPPPRSTQVESLFTQGQQRHGGRRRTRTPQANNPPTDDKVTTQAEAQDQQSVKRQASKQPRQRGKKRSNSGNLPEAARTGTQPEPFQKQAPPVARASIDIRDVYARHGQQPPHQPGSRSNAHHAGSGDAQQQAQSGTPISSQSSQELQKYMLALRNAGLTEKFRQSLIDRQGQQQARQAQAQGSNVGVSTEGYLQPSALQRIPPSQRQHTAGGHSFIGSNAQGDQGALDSSVAQRQLQQQILATQQYTQQRQGQSQLRWGAKSSSRQPGYGPPLQRGTSSQGGYGSGYVPQNPRQPQGSRFDAQNTQAATQPTTANQTHQQGIQQQADPFSNNSHDSFHTQFGTDQRELLRNPGQQSMQQPRTPTGQINFNTWDQPTSGQFLPGEPFDNLGTFQSPDFSLLRYDAIQNSQPAQQNNQQGQQDTQQVEQDQQPAATQDDANPMELNLEDPMADLDQLHAQFMEDMKKVTQWPIFLGQLSPSGSHQLNTKPNDETNASAASEPPGDQSSVVPVPASTQGQHAPVHSAPAAQTSQVQSRVLRPDALSQTFLPDFPAAFVANVPAPQPAQDSTAQDVLDVSQPIEWGEELNAPELFDVNQPLNFNIPGFDDDYLLNFSYDLPPNDESGNADLNEYKFGQGDDGEGGGEQ